MRKGIEVLAHCKADGSLEPLRFRYETAEHHLVSVTVDRIVSRNRVCYVGVEAFVYLCRATEGEKQRMFELRYEVKSHTWALQAVIY